MRWIITGREGERQPRRATFLKVYYFSYKETKFYL